MMAATRAGHHLIDRLPTVRGALRADAGLGRGTWFGVGGAADVLFQPADAADLSAFLAELPAEVPVSVLGVGSNLLVRDGGVAGVVVRLGRGFAGIRADGTEIVAGAAASDIHLAVAAADIGIGGLEFLRGIPGSVGGAVRMNAGAYDREVADVLVEACAIDRAGRRHRVGPRELGYAYRHSAAPADWIFVAARLAGRAAQPAKVHALMTEIAARREASQPIRTRTGGSTFKNPPGEKAWQLIDRAGCRGLRRGGAQVSERHCNFLINAGGATAADLEGLGEEVRRRVHEASGVLLDWEIVRLGRPAGGIAGGNE